MKNLVVLILAVVILIIILVVAYKRSWLDRILPKPWREEKSEFVGAYARTPGMEQCLDLGPHGKWSYFNRCTWV